MQLDEYQQAVHDAVLAPGGNLRVAAVAGSGKTTMLVATIASLLQAGVPPEDIIATTFTSKAGKEMTERLAKVVPAHLLHRLRIGTFHSLCLRELRALNPERWNMRRCISVNQRDADVPHERQIWYSILKWRKEGVWGTGVKGLDLGLSKREMGQYSLALSVLRSHGYAPDSIEEHRSIDETEEDLEKFHDAITLFAAAKHALHAFDFDDVLADYWEMAQACTLTTGAKYVFVDEAQDNSQVQLDIAQFWARDGRLILLGDGRQAIYSWRGASPEIFIEADRRLGAATLPVQNNYRSRGTIIDVSNAVAAGASWAVGGEALKQRQEPANVRTLAGDDAHAEAARVAYEIAMAHHHGGKLADFAILCRTNATAEAFEGACMAQRLPVIRVGGRPFWSQKLALDFLAYCILGELDSWPSFSRVYNVPEKPPRYIGRAFLDRVDQAMRRPRPRPLPDIVLGIAPSLSGRSSRGAAGLGKFLQKLRATPWNLRPAMIADLLTPAETGIEPGDEDIEGFLLSCAAIARRFQSAVELANYADACTRNTLAANEGAKLPQDRVTISTIHRAKGLEWPTVYVSATAAVFPHARSVGDAARYEEERRLFYVAVSRARDELVVTHAEYDNRGKFAGPSRFTEDHVMPFLGAR